MNKISLAALALATGTVPCFAEPAPGEMFKEFHWSRGRVQYIFNPDNTAKDAPKRTPPALPLDLDLEGATKAEVIVEYWSGHPGTSAKTISFNDRESLVSPCRRTRPLAQSAISPSSANRRSTFR